MKVNDVDTHEARRVFRLPLEGDVWIAVQGPFPITDAQWVQFMHILDVMKPGLVQREAPSDG